MCGPAAVPLMIGSAVVSAYGAYTSARAQKKAQEYSAGIDRLNAQAAEWQAEDALVRGETEASNIRRKALSVQGEQQAVLAGRGIALDSGSPLSLLEDTDYFSKLDIATVRSNAEKESWAARVRATGAYAAANIAQYTADSIKPGFSALTSVLGSSAQVASVWYKGRTTPPGSSPASVASALAL
jgi:hypothetical protein